MGRALQTPTPALRNVTIVVPQSKGGTGVTSINSLPAALGIVSKQNMGAPFGVATTDIDGHILSSQLPVSAATFVTIDGPDEILQGQTILFKITNYDINTNYAITVSAGTITRSGANLTFVAPNAAQSVLMVVNSRNCVIDVKATAPDKPSILTPVYGTKFSAPSYTFTSSAYTGTLSLHFSSDWQIATDVDFNVLKFQTLNDTTNKVSWPMTGLVAATSYLVRVRHKATDGTYGSWSEPTRFTTL